MFRSRWFLRAGVASLFLFVGLSLGVRWYGHSVNSVAEEVPSADASEDTSSDEKPPLTLPSEEREYLWQLEHHGNLLSRHGFTALANALRRQDAAALAALLSNDFTGQAPQSPREVRLDADFAQVVRQEDAGQPPLPLDRAAFVDHLLRYRRLFAQPPEVKLALMALSPTVRGNLDTLWQGTCQLRMWGEVGPGQPGEVVLYLQYRLSCPTEERLQQRGWLRSCTILQSQEARASHSLLREVTVERGIDTRRFHDNWTCSAGQPIEPVTGGVYLCDYDRDGILDLLITDIKGYNLYKGLPGGKLTDVTWQVGLLGVFPPQESTGLVAAFADLDGDGWEDLILGNSIYRNDQGRRFQDVTPRTNLRWPADVTGIALADFDRDGRLDLYLTRGGRKRTDSWIEGKNGDEDGNHLWRNLGNWRFQDVTASSGAAGGQRSSFTAVWLDADNDGWPDLYVPNEFGSGVLLHNEGNGRFREHSLQEGASDFGTMGVTCGDINNDGRIDVYVANMYSKAGNRVIGNLRPGTYSPEITARLRSLVAGSQLYVNRGGLHFEPVGPKYQVSAIGWAYGAALVDLDNDGWLDLYATCGYVSKSRNELDG
jgi:hypothetical protein